MSESITITREEFDKLARLLDFANWYIDDYPKHMYPEQYESDKEEITQAQEVIQHLQALLDTVS
jgi:flagellin-specific chaperone FliS